MTTFLRIIKTITISEELDSGILVAFRLMCIDWYVYQPGIVVCVGIVQAFLGTS